MAYLSVPYKPALHTVNLLRPIFGSSVGGTPLPPGLSLVCIMADGTKVIVPAPPAGARLVAYLP